MIKCPNCGSTAQVREKKALPTEFSVPNREATQKTRCTCGCGCRFTFVRTVNYREEVCKDYYENVSTQKKERIGKHILQQWREEAKGD
jgi:hypothetical protein